MVKHTFWNYLQYTFHKFYYIKIVYLALQNNIYSHSKNQENWPKRFWPSVHVKSNLNLTSITLTFKKWISAIDILWDCLWFSIASAQSTFSNYSKNNKYQKSLPTMLINSFSHWQLWPLILFNKNHMSETQSWLF